MDTNHNAAWRSIFAGRRPWERAFFVLFFGVLGLRILFAAVFPLDFAGDEAYYWDWGRRLDWGYYSKPPMVGWLFALAGWLGNDSFFVFKLVPVVLTALGTLALAALARDRYGGFRRRPCSASCSPLILRCSSFGA